MSKDIFKQAYSDVGSNGLTAPGFFNIDRPFGGSVENVGENLDYVRRQSAVTPISSSTFTETDQNVDEILCDSTFISCLTYKSESVSQLPISILKKDKDGRVVDEIKNPNKHDVLYLLYHPNPQQTRVHFIKSVVNTFETYGNCYIRIQRRESDNTPIALYVLKPGDVKKDTYRGEDTYHYTNGDQERIPYDSLICMEDITFGGQKGLSKVLQSADLYHAKIAITKRIRRQFNNPEINMIGFHPKDWTQQSKDEAKKAINEARSSNPNAKNWILMQDDMEFKEYKGLTPQEEDMYNLREQINAEIAGSQGVPPYRTGGIGEKYNNERLKYVSFFRDTLNPLLMCIKEAFNKKLLKDNESIHFDTSEYEEGDNREKAFIAKEMVSNGIYTPNEGRELMGKEPLKGDKEADMIRRTAPTIDSNNGRSPATGGGDGPQSTNGQEVTDDE